MFVCRRLTAATWPTAWVGSGGERCLLVSGRGPGRGQTPGGWRQRGPSKASGLQRLLVVLKREPLEETPAQPGLRSEPGVARCLDEVHLPPGSGSPGSQRRVCAGRTRAGSGFSPGPQQLPRHLRGTPSSGRPLRVLEDGVATFGFESSRDTGRPRPLPASPQSRPPSGAPAPGGDQRGGCGRPRCRLPGPTGLRLGVTLTDVGARVAGQ